MLRVTPPHWTHWTHVPYPHGEAGCGGLCCPDRFWTNLWQCSAGLLTCSGRALPGFSSRPWQVGGWSLKRLRGTMAARFVLRPACPWCAAAALRTEVFLRMTVDLLWKVLVLVTAVVQAGNNTRQTQPSHSCRRRFV